MGLREIANNDLQTILEKDSNGFRWPIKITSPSGKTTPRKYYGFTNDISLVIDPDTGIAVTGNLITVACFTRSLIKIFNEIPKNVPQQDNKPWVVEFEDINGIPGIFKVQDVNPDNALGMTVLTLEFYQK